MFLEVNGVQYHLELYGKGKPLLLLHGFTGSSQDWLPFIEQWEQHFQLIAVDIIGHGLTEHPDDYTRYSIETVAADLVAVLDQLKIEKTAVLGYSMGGRLGLTMSILYPERVQVLLLESSSPGLQTKEEQESRIAKDHSLADRIETGGIETFVDAWENIPLFASQTSLPNEIKENLRSGRLQNHPKGLANSLRGMGTGQQPSWWSHLAQLDIPVLLLAGEWDEKFCTINELMDAQLKNSQLVIVDNAGHTLHLEQPGFFGKIIIDYLMDKL